MEAILRHQGSQDEDLPKWITKGLRLSMPCDLENRKSHDGSPQAPQWLHLDLGLPGTMKALEEYRKGRIVITAGAESVFIWLVPNSHKMMEDLAIAHIRCDIIMLLLACHLLSICVDLTSGNPYSIECCTSYLRHGPMPVNEDGIEEPRQYALMSPSEIDELVTMDWSIQQPVLLEVEPWTYAVLGLLTVHAGGKGRLVMEGEEMVVPPDYRYHRYWMPDSLCKVESFLEEGGYIKTQPLDNLGFYDYSVHKHTAVAWCFKQPPGAM